MINKEKIWHRYVWCIVYLSILLTTPYVFMQFLPVPSEKIILVMMFALLLIPFVIKGKFKLPPLGFNFCIIAQVVCWLMYYFIHNDASYITRIFYTIFVFAIVTAVSNFGKIEDFVKQNNALVCLQAVLGLFAFLLVFVGVISPIFNFQNVDGRTAYCYGLTCTNAIFGNIIRPAGYFDEPGALAFWGVYALILNYLFIKNNKIEIALIIGLLSTLSMAYYIQLILYLVFFKIKFNYKSMILVTVIVGICSYIYMLGPGDTLYQLTYGRFEADQYGNIETNRDILTEKAKLLYHRNPIFGNGAENIEKGEYIADNPYETLATDGIVGTFIIYLPLIVLILRNLNRKDIIFGVIIIAVGYLQRPFHIVILHYIMLYVFLYLGLRRKTRTNYIT